jgi:hypothetical protein
MPEFYDDLAPLYHPIHQDWPASVRRQGAQLAALIRAEWPVRRRVLDVSCGIGHPEVFYQPVLVGTWLG